MQNSQKKNEPSDRRQEENDYNNKTPLNYLDWLCQLVDTENCIYPRDIDINLSSIEEIILIRRLFRKWETRLSWFRLWSSHAPNCLTIAKMIV